MSEDTVVEELENEEVEQEEAPLHPYDLPGEWFVLNAQSGHEKKVQTITDDHIQSVDEKVSLKEKEIMTI